MTRIEARKLRSGLYRVFWKGGDESLAAVGQNDLGDKWIAPSNWLSPDETGAHWRTITRVEVIEINTRNPDPDA